MTDFIARLLHQPSGEQGIVKFPVSVLVKGIPSRGSGYIENEYPDTDPAT
jgi:hypothetical protein